MHAMHLYTAPEQVSNIKDINMGTLESATVKKGGSGLTKIRRLKISQPNFRVLCLSMQAMSMHCQQAMPHFFRKLLKVACQAQISAAQHSTGTCSGSPPQTPRAWRSLKMRYSHAQSCLKRQKGPQCGPFCRGVALHGQLANGRLFTAL